MFEVHNQPPPLEPYDLLHSDAVLREAVRRTDFLRKRRAWAGTGRGIGLSLFFHGAGFTGGGEAKLASRAALEHLVPKARGVSFTAALSLLADEYCWDEGPNCPGCPLSGECLTAQEAGVESLAAGRGHRAKPR